MRWRERAHLDACAGIRQVLRDSQRTSDEIGFFEPTDITRTLDRARELDRTCRVVCAVANELPRTHLNTAVFAFDRRRPGSQHSEKTPPGCGKLTQKRVDENCEKQLHFVPPPPLLEKWQ